MAYDHKNAGSNPADIKKAKLEQMAEYTTAENVSMYASIYLVSQ